MLRRLLPFVFLAACSSAPKPDQAPPAGDAAAKAALPPGHGGAGPATAAPGVAAAFSCDDATTVFALFRTDSTGKAEVALAIGDERLHLPQLPSASGARYSDAGTTFWNKGSEVEFTRGGKTTTCRAPK